MLSNEVQYVPCNGSLLVDAGRPQMCIYGKIKFCSYHQVGKESMSLTGLGAACDFLIYTTHPQPSILFYICLDQLHLHIGYLFSEYTSFSFFPGDGKPVGKSGKSEPGSGSEGREWTEDVCQSKVNCCSGPAWPSGTQEDQLLVWFTFARCQKCHHQDAHVAVQTGLDSGR